MGSMEFETKCYELEPASVVYLFTAFFLFRSAIEREKNDRKKSLIAWLKTTWKFYQSFFGEKVANLKRIWIDASHDDEDWRHL
jgi:hypothetical protein